MHGTFQSILIFLYSYICENKVHEMPRGAKNFYLTSNHAIRWANLATKCLKIFFDSPKSRKQGIHSLCICTLKLLSIKFSKWYNCAHDGTMHDVSAIFRRYFGDVSAMFRRCSGDLPAMFRQCFGDVSAMCRRCFGECFSDVLAMFRRCSGDVSAMFLWCFGDVSAITWRWFGDLSAMSRQCFDDVSKIFRRCFGDLSEIVR